MITAGALSIGLATGAVGIGAPTAQAVEGAAATVSATSGGFLSCSTPAPLGNEPNSTAIACLSVYDGTVTSFVSVTFNSPLPATWEGCYLGANLEKVGAGGVLEPVGAENAVDCTAAARAKQTISTSYSTPVVVGTTYVADAGMISLYNVDHGMWGSIAKSARILVLN